jgi:hemoglobin
MKDTAVTETNIEVLVYTFYARVKTHETLGPIFNSALAGRWDAHLARMVDFWSSVLLASGRYSGSPLHAHLLVQGLEPEHFRDWLVLFRETLDDLFAPAIAERIFTAASRMGERMQVVLFVRPQAEGYGVGQGDASAKDSRHALGDAQTARVRATVAGLKETR